VQGYPAGMIILGYRDAVRLAWRKGGKHAVILTFCGHFGDFR